MRIFILFICLCFSYGASLDEKIKSMIMVGVNNNDLNQLKFAKFAFISNKNFNSRDEFKILINRLKNMNLNIAINFDDENLLKNIKNNVINIKKLKNKNEQELQELYKNFALKLKQFNIDLILAPNIDVQDPSLQPYDATALNEQDITKLAKIFINELEKMQITTCLKNFIKSSNNDLKQNLYRSQSTKQNLFPYENLINLGLAKSILVSHLYILDIDESTPASLSPIVINGFLRARMHFGGVVISDDMQEEILDNFTLKIKILNFITAGGDIVFFKDTANINAKTIFDIIKTAVQDGQISHSRINQSYRRIKKIID